MFPLEECFLGFLDPTYPIPNFAKQVIRRQIYMDCLVIVATFLLTVLGLYMTHVLIQKSLQNQDYPAARRVGIEITLISSIGLSVMVGFSYNLFLVLYDPRWWYIGQVISTH